MPPIQFRDLFFTSQRTPEICFPTNHTSAHTRPTFQRSFSKRQSFSISRHHSVWRWFFFVQPYPGDRVQRSAHFRKAQRDIFRTGNGSSASWLHRLKSFLITSSKERAMHGAVTRKLFTSCRGLQQEALAGRTIFPDGWRIGWKISFLSEYERDNK